MAVRSHIPTINDQLLLTNPRGALHRDKRQTFKNGHVTITTPI